MSRGRDTQEFREESSGETRDLEYRTEPQEREETDYLRSGRESKETTSLRFGERRDEIDALEPRDRDKMVSEAAREVVSELTRYPAQLDNDHLPEQDRDSGNWIMKMMKENYSEYITTQEGDRTQAQTTFSEEMRENFREQGKDADWEMDNVDNHRHARHIDRIEMAAQTLEGGTTFHQRDRRETEKFHQRLGTENLKALTEPGATTTQREVEQELRGLNYKLALLEEEMRTNEYNEPSTDHAHMSALHEAVNTEVSRLSETFGKTNYVPEETNWYTQGEQYDIAPLNDTGREKLEEILMAVETMPGVRPSELRRVEKAHRE